MEEIKYIFVRYKMCWTSLEDVHYWVGPNIRNDAFILMSIRRADHGTIFSSCVKNVEHMQTCAHIHTRAAKVVTVYKHTLSKHAIAYPGPLESSKVHMIRHHMCEQSAQLQLTLRKARLCSDSFSMLSGIIGSSILTPLETVCSQLFHECN